MTCRQRTTGLVICDWSLNSFTEGLPHHGYDECHTVHQLILLSYLHLHLGPEHLLHGGGRRCRRRRVVLPPHGRRRQQVVRRQGKLLGL